jgi:hypothetical protein
MDSCLIGRLAEYLHPHLTKPNGCLAVERDSLRAEGRTQPGDALTRVVLKGFLDWASTNAQPLPGAARRPMSAGLIRETRCCDVWLGCLVCCMKNRPGIHVDRRPAERGTPR